MTEEWSPALRPLRSRRCACGGTIVAITDDARLIAQAVRAHNATARHREWRALGGLAYDPESQGRLIRKVPA